MEIGREMMLASNLFMNNLEEDYTMDDQLLQQRELSNDRALEMMSELAAATGKAADARRFADEAANEFIKAPCRKGWEVV